MSEKRDIAGLWWLPTNPDERWTGTLTLEQNKSPKLTIAVQKSAFESFGQRLSAPPIIHGIDQNNRPISLIVPGWPRTGGGMALSQVEYSANYAVMSVPASASVALASSGRAVAVQRPVSERAAKQVKIPVKLRPDTNQTPINKGFRLEARVGIGCASFFLTNSLSHIQRALQIAHEHAHERVAFVRVAREAL